MKNIFFEIMNAIGFLIIVGLILVGLKYGQSVENEIRCDRGAIEFCK